MKGLIKGFFVFVFVGFLCAAPLFGGGRREKSSGTGGVNVVAVNFPAYDFVRAVAGDRVSLTMLLPPGAESHSYEPSPRDIRTIQRADIFIYTGGESDEWVDGILESMDTGKMRILRLMDCVELVEEEIVEGMQEEEEEEEGIAYDEHVWTSPQNAALIVGRIAGLLCEADGANASVYESNAAAYREKLEALDASFKAAAGGGVRKTIVFGDRFPFRYFADAYGLDYFAAFPGCSTETECSAATIAYLINKVRDEGIPVVFHIELANEGIADTICEATGARKLLLHACHNVSKRDFEDGKTYLDFMAANVDALGEALR
ncbi:MAG: metal ABC transporter substrate-binding protein [Treponema sp.]|jgi:zinc transport system substrate-binding protein|nr:metal ABC transporter substrate-binding protein [Treponema sp.]